MIQSAKDRVPKLKEAFITTVGMNMKWCAGHILLHKRMRDEMMTCSATKGSLVESAD